VQALVFGGADLAADLGATMAWESLLYARARLVQAAATAGRAVLDVPYLDLDRDDGLAGEIGAVQRLGFTGKLAIHPKHVPPINAAFTPTAAAIVHSERIIAAAQAAGGGVCVVDGRMIDAPVVRTAERTLARRPR
jgi:citrate lyase beta subunit